MFLARFPLARPVLGTGMAMLLAGCSSLGASYSQPQPQLDCIPPYRTHWRSCRKSSLSIISPIWKTMRAMPRCTRAISKCAPSMRKSPDARSRKRKDLPWIELILPRF